VGFSPCLGNTGTSSIFRFVPVQNGDLKASKPRFAVHPDLGQLDGMKDDFQKGGDRNWPFFRFKSARPALRGAKEYFLHLKWWTTHGQYL